MKTTFLSLIACIFVSLLLPSCRSGISVTKRHYNNGYYIAHSKSGKTINTKQEEKKTVLSTVAKKSYTVPVPVQNPIADNKDLVASNTTQSTQQNKTHKVKQQFIGLKFTPAKTRHINLRQKKTAVDSSDREGLSLLWVIILVLLVLWALGIIGGFTLGGLIYILLVVALILLILWLLRIL